MTESAKLTLTALRALYPDTPFLALGQTALWDEPTKASLRRLLDESWPEARLIAAAHDTDYFAKLPGHPSTHGHGSYALVLHDDAKTRGLWSAAGEMSQLFGSEDVPTRHFLQQEAGVDLPRALQDADDPHFALSELTAAWGWTGIVYTDWDKKVVREIPLPDILHALLDQIDWATQGTIECLGGERAARATRTAALIREWVTRFARQRPDASLSDLYRDLFPRFYELLLGAPPSNLATSATGSLLSFNRDTATLPRFKIVDLFLNPITRRAAIEAYDMAVAGSNIYTLDQFAPGALPFDLVIPGRGRGTLCVPGDGVIMIDTKEPITLCDTGCDFSNVEKLASLVERELGPDCILVGKAVTLLPMLATEFLFVFHEGGSSYSSRSKAMLDRLKARNIRTPDLKPILRLKYSTWDSLSAIPLSSPDEQSPEDRFVLPEHLAQAFGSETTGLHHFADCRGHAIQREKSRLAEISDLRSPRALLEYLCRQDPARWTGTVSEYEAANLTLLRLRDPAQSLQGRIYTFQDQVRTLRAEADQLERAKGDDFRARIQPLRDQLASAKDTTEAESLQARIDMLQSERTLTYDAEIAARRGQIRYALMSIRELKAKRKEIERGEEATAARAARHRAESAAEMTKARLARNAFQAINCLPHTDHRPSAWWFPLVDSTGSWFRRLTDTAEMWLEPLVG